MVGVQYPTKLSGCAAVKKLYTDRTDINSVKDDGIGIAPENLDMVWQRFWQAAVKKHFRIRS